jgi:hypothetical protein
METSEDGIVANISSSFNTPPKPRDWEEAINQVIDDKHKLRCALLDILMAWKFNTTLESMENALQRAQEVLDATDIDPT